MCSTPRNQLLRMEIALERAHALGDVLGEIADPLEIVRDAQRADDLAQIDRHRLAAGDGEDGLFLDLVLQRVDRRSPTPTTRLARSASRRDQRLDRIGDLALREAAHLRDLAGELLQVGVERLDGVFAHRHASSDLRRQPNRPVM